MYLSKKPVRNLAETSSNNNNVDNNNVKKREVIITLIKVMHPTVNKCNVNKLNQSNHLHLLTVGRITQFLAMR